MSTALEGVRDQRHAWAALYPGKDPVPIVQEAALAPGPVWTVAENLTPTGIRSPYRPALSQSLYWLRYPAHTRTVTRAKSISTSCNITKVKCHQGSQRSYMGCKWLRIWTTDVLSGPQQWKLRVTRDCVYWVNCITIGSSSITQLRRTCPVYGDTMWGNK